MTSAPFSSTDWDRYAEYYDALRQLLPYQELLSDVCNALGDVSGMRMLDAGCGTGNVIAALTERRMCMGTHITAIDASEAMLARARAKCPAVAHFELADLNAPVPFASGAFDAITCINTIYALTDPAES